MNLLVVCFAAFLAVLTLLSLLAATIRLLTAVFPYVDPGAGEPAVVAAIHTAAARACPDFQVTRIEELR